MLVFVAITFGIIVNIGGQMGINLFAGRGLLHEVNYNIINLIILIFPGSVALHIIFTGISAFVKHDFVNRYCAENGITKEEFFQKDLNAMLELWRADWGKPD
ncbi:MAG: hypothetical protein Q9M33_13450 [Robiginitomaculum sp.]|nr:hypothetical protein [Robiginitomaculum sp.]